MLYSLLYLSHTQSEVSQWLVSSCWEESRSEAELDVLSAVAVCFTGQPGQQVLVPSSGLYSPAQLGGEQGRPGGVLGQQRFLVAGHFFLARSATKGRHILQVGGASPGGGATLPHDQL